MIKTLKNSKLSKSNDYKKLKAFLYALDITNEATVNKIYQIRQHLIEVNKNTLTIQEYDIMISRIRVTSDYKTTLLKVLEDAGLVMVMKYKYVIFNEIIFNIEDINVVFSDDCLVVNSGNKTLKTKCDFERYLSFMLNLNANSNKKINVKNTILVLDQFEYCANKNVMIIGKNKTFSAISKELGFERSFVTQRLVTFREHGYLRELKSDLANRKEFSIKESFLNCKEIRTKHIEKREFTLYVTQNGVIKIKLENEKEILND